VVAYNHTLQIWLTCAPAHKFNTKKNNVKFHSQANTGNRHDVNKLEISGLAEKVDLVEGSSAQIKFQLQHRENAEGGFNVPEESETLDLQYLAATTSMWQICSLVAVDLSFRSAAIRSTLS